MLAVAAPDGDELAIGEAILETDGDALALVVAVVDSLGMADALIETAAEKLGESLTGEELGELDTGEGETEGETDGEAAFEGEMEMDLVTEPLREKEGDTAGVLVAVKHRPSYVSEQFCVSLCDGVPQPDPPRRSGLPTNVQGLHSAPMVALEMKGAVAPSAVIDVSEQP